VLVADGDGATKIPRESDLEAVLAKARKVSEREQSGQKLMGRPGMTYAKYKELS
jgi:hypothetical protein